MFHYIFRKSATRPREIKHLPITSRVYCLSRVKHGRLVKLSVPETLAVYRDLLQMMHDECDAPDWELSDIQHNLCELDKYLRTKNGEGTPRSRYPGI